MNKTDRQEVSARETLLPTMFPVLLSPSDRGSPFPSASVPPPPPSGYGVPALQTVRDTPHYPRWSRRWINQKLENPRVLYPVCGTIVFVTVLLVADFFVHRPIVPVVPVVPPQEARLVKINSSPAGADIFIDNEPRQEKTNATFEMKPGQHDIRVELSGFVVASHSISISADGVGPDTVEFPLVAIRRITPPTTAPPPPTTKPYVPPPVVAGELHVGSNPDRAAVFVDDKEKGLTPAVIKLSPGKHTIRLEHALYKPAQEEVDVRSGEELAIARTLDPLRAPGSFALLIGVRSATEGLPVFRHAPADVAELGRTLVASGYAKGNVTVLTSSSDTESVPTAEHIREAMRRLVKDRYPGDTLVLALAGPAIVLPGGMSSYFCPVGAELDKPATLLSLEGIYQQLAACPAKTKLVFIDGNRVGPALPARPEPAKPEEIVPPGVILLTATTNGEAGYVNAESRHGAFWIAVFRGLRGAAAGPDHRVTVGGLARYVTEQTRKYVEEAYKAEQTPRVPASAKTSTLVLATPGPALQLLHEAVLLRDTRDYKGAAEKCSQALALQDDLVDAYLLRSATYYRTGNFDGAIEDCAAVLKLDPTNAAAFDFCGDSHQGKAGKLDSMNLSEMKLALQSYTRAIELDPDFAPFFNSRGTARGSLSLAYARKKETDKARAEDELAVADFSRAIDLSPKPRSLYFENRARAYKRLEKLDRSADDYTAALQASDQTDAASLSILYYNRGNVFLQLKDLLRAEDDFAKSAALAPDDPDPRLRRAAALERLGRKEDARKEREKAAELKRRLPGESK